MTPVSVVDDETARVAVLEVADRVFYARGVAGVGMADIRDGSGVSLRRLYGLFPSKRDLVAAWLDERHRTWMAWFTGAIERSRAEGVEPLLAAFDAIDAWAATPGYRGCAFLNTAAEATEIDDTHRAIIAEHKRELIAYLAGLARAGAHEPANDLAESIAVLLDGAIVQSAVLRSSRPIAAARAAAARILQDEPR
jgi:AcrR family transcriptional regulator